ncbi:MAG: hypothetical protein WD648_12110 [Planctomycetaceae bacterium]
MITATMTIMTIMTYTSATWITTGTIRRTHFTGSSDTTIIMGTTTMVITAIMAVITVAITAGITADTTKLKTWFAPLNSAVRPFFPGRTAVLFLSDAATRHC